MKENIDLKELKNKLTEEKNILEEELKSLGRRNPENRDDWEAVPSDLNIPEADRNETADKLEDFEEKFATEGELETRLSDVERALEKISNGTYGKCEVGGEQIETARLIANPSARTCIKHIEG